MNLTVVIEKSSIDQEFLAIAANAKPGISFFGRRYIQVHGYKGHASIDAMAERVIAIARDKILPFNQAERAVGVKIAEHITQIYNESDLIEGKSNCFTRLCCAVHEFFVQFSIGYNGNSRTNTSLTRSIWHDDFDGGFNQRFLSAKTPCSLLRV